MGVGSGVGCSSNQGKSDCSDDETEAQAFSWPRDELIHKQPAVAIYWNNFRHVVIRQESFLGGDDDDEWITLDPVHLPTVISKLLRMQRGEE
jgi:hypothetical protein